MTRYGIFSSAISAHSEDACESSSGHGRFALSEGQVQAATSRGPHLSLAKPADPFPAMSSSTNGLRIYDCTLREGLQAVGVHFSVTDRLRIIEWMDELGFHMVEVGWPFSNHADRQVAEQASKLHLHNTQLVIFGSCARAGTAPAEDANLTGLANYDLPAAHIFGKAWDEHVTKGLRVSLQENLDLVEGSVRWLKGHFDEVSFGGEHFFDGFRENGDYALAVMEAAVAGGADWLDLPDTNGGQLPEQIREAVSAVKAHFDVPLAVHAHDDCGLAVANSLAAVEAGVTIIEGTVNGYGERCGITDLCSILPTLQLKKGIEVMESDSLSRLTALSRFVAQCTGAPVPVFAPYVGRYAFTHKAGVHASAQRRFATAYQHVDPAKVGNASSVSVSQLSGRSNVTHRLSELDLLDRFDEDKMRRFLELLKDKEHDGFQFEAAGGSFDLMALRFLGLFRPHFSVERQELSVKCTANHCSISAKIRLRVGESLEEEDFSSPHGGLSYVLRTVLERHIRPHYPSFPTIRRHDFTTSVIVSGNEDPDKARARITLGDGERSWSCMGISTNYFESLIEATTESFEWILHQLDGTLPSGAHDGA